MHASVTPLKHSWGGLRRSPIVLLLFALIRVSFALQSFLEGLSQKSEQLFGGLELAPLAGVHFFYRPFELASCGFRSGSEPYYKSSSHNGQGSVSQKSRCEVSVRFLSIFCSGGVTSGWAKPLAARATRPKWRVAQMGSSS